MSNSEINRQWHTEWNKVCNAKRKFIYDALILFFAHVRLLIVLLNRQLCNNKINVDDENKSKKKKLIHNICILCTIKSASGFTDLNATTTPQFQRHISRNKTGTGRKAVSVGPLTKVTDTFYLQIRLNRTECLDASETDANICAYSDVKQKAN